MVEKRNVAKKNQEITLQIDLPEFKRKRDFAKFLRQIPKTEIHLHLEGVASPRTIWSLSQKNKIALEGVETEEDIKKRFQIESLQEFISLFIDVVQRSFKEEEDIRYLFKDLRKYLKKNSIVYSEIFFAPTTFLNAGLDFEKMVQILEEESVKLSQDGFEVRFFIDVSRGFGLENAMKNLDLTLKYKTPSILGIGLGGAEDKGKAEEFAEVFEKARKNGLRTVSHAGESVGPESVWGSLSIDSERIGHATSAIQDEALLTALSEKEIPLEICPTSNLFTKKYVSTLSDHPVRAFFDKGLLVTINSDDPSLFSKTLSEEYLALYDEKIFNQHEILTLMKNNIDSTFLSESEKEKIWNDSLAFIQKVTP